MYSHPLLYFLPNGEGAMLVPSCHSAACHYGQTLFTIDKVLL